MHKKRTLKKGEEWLDAFLAAFHGKLKLPVIGS
jgi:hypothetical protein